MTNTNQPQAEKHTPGPWKYERIEKPAIGASWCEVFIQPDADGPRYDICKPDREEDARLIAAAPEEDAALREMVLCFGSGPESEAWWGDHAEEVTACDCGEPSTPEHPHTGDDLRAQVLNRARAAIAKAEGR